MTKPPRSFMRLVVLPCVLMSAVLPMGCAPTGAGSGAGRNLPGDGGQQDQILRDIYRTGRTVGTG